MGRSSRYAQIATGLFADPKVRKLFRRNEEREAYAAMGLWLDVVLDGWEKGERSASAYERTEDETLILALRDAGLFDAEGRIPESSWEKWWGPVAEAKRARADVQRRYRERSHAPKTSRDGHETSRDISRRVSESPSLLSISSISLSSTEEIQSEDEPPARARHARETGSFPPAFYVDEQRVIHGPVPSLDVLDVYERLTTRVPPTGAMDWLDRLVGEYGAERVTRALADEWTERPETRNFLSRTERALHREETKLAERELEEERVRDVRAREEREATRKRDQERALALDPEVGRAGLAAARAALEGRKDAT